MLKFIRNFLFFILFFPICAYANEEGLDIKQILKADKAWDKSALPGFASGDTELKIIHFKIKPGVKTPIHIHTQNGAGYIISGELTMYATNDPHGI